MIFDVTCITHRAKPMFASIISQVTPSESSSLKRDAYEQTFLAHVTKTLGIRSCKRVVMHEPLTNLRKLIVLQMKSDTLEAEVCGLRVGDFRLVTFPGELSAQVGLAIKAAAGQPHSFVAGYTNGYIYYAPTEEQLKNVGNAQEDSDCILAPGWQSLFENKVTEVLKKL